MSELLELKKKLARVLMSKSYRSGDFTLSSGLKSDYYFDCRQSSLYPEGAWLIGKIFNILLADYDIKGVGGMTMGADPLVSACSVISYEIGRPLAGLLVRKEAKGHGTKQYVEGLANFGRGDYVAMLEDVISTGGSVLRAARRVEDAGLKVAVIAAILDRGEGGRQALEAEGYKVISIFTRPELMELSRR